MPKTIYILLVAVVALVSVFIVAADKHNDHNEVGHEGVNHSGMEGHTNDATSHAASGPLPTEGGQSIFEAVSEIVSLLEKDSNTDWNAVSVDKLHAHLQDMDRLMSETTSTTTVLEKNKIKFDIRGNPTSVEAVHRMLPAHAGYIQQSRGWKITTELDPSGATLVLDASSADDIVFLNALGFYGFMSLDSHHQAHHYSMVRGLAH